VTNLRVGVKVLQECIARAGSLEGGLKFYVGAANLEDDGGYAGKVWPNTSACCRWPVARPFRPNPVAAGHPVVGPPMPAPAVEKVAAVLAVPERPGLH
jgi:hypothetical protein